LIEFVSCIVEQREEDINVGKQYKINDGYGKT
jgi:hypothetical protein